MLSFRRAFSHGSVLALSLFCVDDWTYECMIFTICLLCCSCSPVRHSIVCCNPLWIVKVLIHSYLYPHLHTYTFEFHTCSLACLLLPYTLASSATSTWPYRCTLICFNPILHLCIIICIYTALYLLPACNILVSGDVYILENTFSFQEFSLISFSHKFMKEPPSFPSLSSPILDFAPTLPVGTR